MQTNRRVIAVAAALLALTCFAVSPAAYAGKPKPTAQQQVPPGPPGGKPKPAAASGVKERILTSYRINPASAGVCILHVHGDEENARAVARELARDYCANFVDIGSTTRHVHLTLSGGTKCEADPNRIFSEDGLKGPAMPGGCAKQAEAKDVLRDYAKAFIRAVDKCRAFDKGLPIVAFHNNGGLLVTSSELGAAESDKKLLKGRPNPSKVEGGDLANFILVTRPSDFGALSHERNLFLQSLANPPKDGSLSTKLANRRYFNVEARGRTGGAGLSAGRALGARIFALLKVPLNKGDRCPGPAVSSLPPGP